MPVPLLQLLDQHKDEYVRFVAFADPPVLSDTEDGPIVSPIHGWASKAIDEIKNATIVYGRNDPTVIGNITSATWHHKGGPLICGRIRLSSVLLPQYDRLRINFTSLCACIEYFLKGNNHCDSILCREFIRVSGTRGCNPGGQVIFPQAPRFTSVITLHRRTRLFNQARNRYNRFLEAPKPTEELAKTSFPKTDWGSNSILETIIDHSAAHKTLENGIQLFSAFKKIQDGKEKVLVYSDVQTTPPRVKDFIHFPDPKKDEGIKTYALFET